MLLLLGLLACRNDKDLDSGALDRDGDGWPADEDCDDEHESVFPGAAERCNGVDDDCDGTVDVDAEDAGSWFLDGDGDGFGAGEAVTACDQPAQGVTVSGDCDDEDIQVHPDATEVCDGVDNDCDGVTDPDDAQDALTWYADTDTDGEGDAEAPAQACEQPEGHVDNDRDCDDQDATVYTTAPETCDGVDDDCDGAVDEGVTLSFYEDGDEDGYGDADTRTQACSAPSGFVADATDCDPSDGDTWPGAAESCDSKDNDCDGDIDEEVTLTFYEDGDGDGYGLSTSTTEACSEPSGYASLDGDCDDSDTAYNPGATPGCDGEDYDCDGDVDNDGDGDGQADMSCGGEDCDDSDSSRVSCTTCAELLSMDSTLTSGSYTIDPDGNGDLDVSCDMSTDGGGWTLMVHVYDLGGFNENDFIGLYGHNLWTDEAWSWDGSTLTDGLASLETLSSQGSLGVTTLDGLWDDLRMTCSQSDSDSTESSYAQIDGYATSNGSWDLLGAVSNGTSYAVDSSLNSVGQSTIWHDNETTTINSGHYLCDYTNSGSSGGAQFGFCYTDFLTNYNNQDYGDSIVSLAFGTSYGADGWSDGFTMECGAMGTTALQNTGTVSLWVR